MKASSVTLEGVSKYYGELAALDQVTLEVPAGQFLAILGPSGSGKTTAMRLIGGFERPERGSVKLDGQDVTALLPYRRDVNTVFQSYGLFPHMSVLDNVAYGPRLRHIRRGLRHSQAREMLKLVALSGVERRRPGQLSGGQRQRVALARALINEPGVLLLDEPLGALDRKLREEMQVELRRIHTELGTTFIYVTHDQDEALSMADRLIVMRSGRVEQEGHPQDVYDAPDNLWVAEFVGTSNTVQGVLTRIGEVAILETDLTEIRGVHVHDDLRSGERAVAVIRPERVELAYGRDPKADFNTIHGRLEESIAVGGQLRAVVRTAGGQRFALRLARGGNDELPSEGVGDQVQLRWAPSAVHIYRAPVLADQVSSETQQQ